MKYLEKIKQYLSEPRLKNVDPDSDEMLRIHKEILSEKTMMKNVFSEFYDLCISLDKKFFNTTIVKRVEIGAGVSFFKERYPDILATDIKNASNLDMVVDAQQMPFENNTVSAIYGINCFHHFPNPEKFFVELNRVLETGGGCVLIEPYYGFVARNFYKNIFKTESFDLSQLQWSNDSIGFMNGANQALSHIVFIRDKKKFEQLFPNLEITYKRPLNNYLRYLLSGGLNFKQLLPSYLSWIIKVVEFVLRPFNTVFALHHVIVIKKVTKN
ncbi:methyltransferase domain-containing protein [Flavobacterium lacisediminis]|uniref:Class I SAM-dependent methyltransferase n=1 Tax=Flavobacterium lacisediminis TaxID=2989705 RepID=A0ABT3EK70_9FLAO|nr:class I SAM-dependent methyltransferase [Flavobacterium lacisediminis]MCW1148824.1 class I SAM-dependent methyltransferase [Flavobacterium lacisediminis]